MFLNKTLTRKLAIINPEATASTKQSVEGMLTDLELSALLSAGIPRLLSIFGNIETTSQDTSGDPSGSWPFASKSSNLLIKSIESLTKDGRLCERGLR